MAQQKHFGTDGIRGPVGQGLLTSEGAEQIGRAVGMTFAEPGDVVPIGHDPRDSSPWLADGLARGLNAVGVDAQVVGNIPTPGLAYTTRSSEAARAGIMVTASHNSAKDNGIKVFSGDGGKLPDTAEAGINSWINQVIPDRGKTGRTQQLVGEGERYVAFLQDTADTSLAGMRIGLDTANGATSGYAEQVFRGLGAEVVPMFDHPDGQNINENCGATHTEALQQAVGSLGLDIGLAFDGDGDRLMLVDATGRELNGDNALHILGVTGGHKTVVATVMSNMGLEVALRKSGIDLLRTRVGDRYVLEALIREGLNLGGERSGHVIQYEKLATGDGMLAAIHVVQAVRTSGEPMAAWGDKWDPYPQALVNVPVSANPKELIDHADVQAAVAAVEAQYGDEGRVLLRPSGTEPLLRVMVEGADPDATANHLAGFIARISNAV